jgi:hypothetical protein
MPTQLQATGIAAPGWKGLNLQGGAGLLPPEWSTVATNFLFDDSGRMASRKGWTKSSSTDLGTESADLGGVDEEIKQIYEFISDQGIGTRIFSTDGGIYSESAGTLVDRTASLTIDDGNWKFQNWNDGTTDLVLGINSQNGGENYISWDGVAGGFVEVTLSGTSNTPVVNNGTDFMVAWGKVWGLVDRGTGLVVSKNLDHTTLPPDADGTGTLDLYNVFDEGMDFGIALATFNGQLVIFGKNNILIYGNAGLTTNASTDGTWNYVDLTASNFGLIDHITGYGCVARDSVQKVGSDILFLSASGIQSLGRLIQERSAPQKEETINVRDTIITDIKSQADKTAIRSTYNEEEGFYLITFPDLIIPKVYMLDMKGSLENGGRRITTWEDINPTALFTSRLDIKTLYMAQTISTSHFISTYVGTDDSGTDISLDYETGWLILNPDPQSQHRYVIPKSITGVFVTADTHNLTYKWAFDFNETFKTSTGLLIGGVPSKYSIAKYSVDSYTAGIGIQTSKSGMRGFGEHIKYGFTINTGSTFAASKLELHLKLGRIHT